MKRGEIKTGATLDNITYFIEFLTGNDVDYTIKNYYSDEEDDANVLVRCIRFVASELDKTYQDVLEYFAEYEWDGK
jgi:hypothetical protein